MNKRIRLLTVVLLILGMLVVYIVTHDIKHSTGVLLGGCLGLIGFNMIEAFANRIVQQKGGNAMRAYIWRLCVYGIVIALGMMKNINVLAILAGLLIHKGSLVLVGIYYKEDDEVGI